MDPGIPVPPPLYGGHERLVYMFAKEYSRLGHSVTLLAGPNSFCEGCQIVSFGVNDLARNKQQKTKELLFAWQYLFKNRNQFDLIHNFGRLLYLLPILPFSVKKIMTYGRAVTQNGIKFFTSLPNKNLIFTACSNDCVATGNVAGNWKTVYNAIDFSKYTFNENIAQDAPLMFLGRLDKIKGVHTAIQIAKETNHKLWIGGNIPDTEDNLKFFKENIEPFFDDSHIIYLGPLNDEQKNHYLGQSKALLFPIEWSEPFGMVMVEAMACGTPVIGFNKGSVPEVIDEDVTGYIVENAKQMVEKIKYINKIDRKKCKQTAESRFNVNIISKQYLNIFNN